MRQNIIPYHLQFFAEESTAAAEAAGTGIGEAAKDTNAAAGKAGAEDAAKEDTAVRESQEEKKPVSTGAASTNSKEDIAALVQEEIRKANMSPEEKDVYEKEQKEKALSDRENAIYLRERQADAKELLADSGLPVEFRDMVIGKDKEATQANVKTFKEKFDAAVQAQVEQRLKGSTPGTGTGHTGGDEKQTLTAQVESYL